ncbi:MAG: amidohydrolase [Planctomycetota bacterium]|nr:amidohydrolase [Planctomycetota bacterium]
MAARITAYLVALIVGTTFVAGLIVGAQRDDDGPVDLIVVNGNVYTSDADNPTAEAVAVQGNKILMVGSNRDVQRLRRPQTIVVDAKGGSVLPGFNDAQAEFLNTGLELREIDLLDARTVPDVETTVRAWAAANIESAWVIGRGWHADSFAGGLPTRELLDTLVPDRPAFLAAADGESGWANSAALKLANITKRTPHPPDGTIVKDSRTGEPTGVIKGAAIELVTSLLPKPTREQRLQALRDAIELAHRRGVTSVQDTGGSAADLPLYDELRRTAELDVRVYASMSADPPISTEELAALDGLREKYGDDPLFKTGAVNFVIESEHADRDVADTEFETLVAALDQRGWQVMIRAIGDGAVRLALDAFQYATSQNPGVRDRRHRFESESRRSSVDIGDPKADPMDAIDLATISKAGVTASRQPDVADPMQGLQLAVDAAAPDGEPRREWSAAERRALSQAIDAYTRDAAWASFDEHRKGTLKRDMLADIVVLSRDIFSIAPSRLAETDVAVTIFNGKVVFSRPAESND